MFKHILLPTDGSELSEKAIRSGVELAKAIGARVTGFYATEAYPLAFYGEYMPADPFTAEEFGENENKRAAQYLSVVQAAAEAAGIPCDVYSVTSNWPYEAIIRAAEAKGCDLIFMATHGRKGIAGLLMGSETTKVLTHSKIPVLAFR